MTDNVPVINERSLQRHLDVDHDLMKSEITAVVKEKCAQIQGDLFVQIIYGGCLLVSGKKA